MGLFSAEKIFGIKLRESANDGSDFGTPDADYRFTFLGEDGQWHTKDSSAVVRYMPGAELDRVTATAAVTVSGTSAASPTTVLTCSAVTFDGGAVDIEFFSPSVITPGATNGFVAICLYESTTSLGNMAVVLSGNSTANIRAAVMCRFRITPTAAAHTYIIKAYRDGGAGTASIQAGAGGSDTLVPMYARIIKA